MVQPGRAGWPCDMQALPPSQASATHMFTAGSPSAYRGKKGWGRNLSNGMIGNLLLANSGYSLLGASLYFPFSIGGSWSPPQPDLPPAYRLLMSWGSICAPQFFRPGSAAGGRQAASPEIPARLWSQQQQSHAPKPGRREADLGAQTGSTGLCKEKLPPLRRRDSAVVSVVAYEVYYVDFILKSESSLHLNICQL